MARRRFYFSALALFALAGCASFETQLQPSSQAPTPVKTLTATVTTRMRGVLVDPQTVTYAFAPEFDGSMGALKRANLGIYELRADNIPADRPYTITVLANYSDSVAGSDGVPERHGRAYSGTVRIAAPYGRDNRDLGFFFLDLQ